MLAKIKNWGLFLRLKERRNEAKRQKDLKKVAESEKLWDLRLRGLR